MDEIKGIARVTFHPGQLDESKRLTEAGDGEPKLFTPWMAA